jgi:hypothetical protein
LQVRPPTPRDTWLSSDRNDLVFCATAPQQICLARQSSERILSLRYADRILSFEHAQTGLHQATSCVFCDFTTSRQVSYIRQLPIQP